MADKAAVDFEESWLQSWKKSVGIVLKQSLHIVQRSIVCMEYISWWDSAFFVSFYEIATGTQDDFVLIVINMYPW